MNWQTISIFISSTFKDMHSERDILVKKVFPLLREKLAPYRIKLIDIDLRWGITEDQSENNETIEFCLNSIENCKPYFLGLMGERYGWIPDTNLDNLTNSFPEKISITAMEIIHGVLSDKKTAIKSTNVSTSLLSQLKYSESVKSNALFFFRDPNFEKTMPDDLLEIVKSESPEHYQKLVKLKDEIKNHPLKRKPIENYACSYKGLAIDWSILEEEAPKNVKELITKHVIEGVIIPDVYKGMPDDVKQWLQNNSTILLDGLDSFSNQVASNLWSLFCEEFPELNEPPKANINIESLEDDEHLRFLDEITELFIGREQIELDLSKKLNDKTSTTPIIITGSSGSGKSALLAQTVKNWQDKNPQGLAIVHFTGASIIENHPEALFNRFLRLLSESTQLKSTEINTGIITTEIQNILNTISPEKQVLIAIDSIDKLFGNNGLDLQWIPDVLKENLNIVLTFSDDKPYSSFNFKQLKQLNVNFHQIPALRKEERKKLIHQLPALSAKTMDKKHIDLLANHPASNLPLFLSIALEELRMFGSFERLEKRIKKFPNYTGKQGLEAIYHQMLQRLELEIGTNAVVQPLSLLVCSVTGLKETEIKQLCPNIASEKLALLWRELRVHLQIKDGLLNFNHDSLLKSIQKNYLNDKAAKRQIHTQLAEFFKGKPLKKRIISELLEHHYQCADFGSMQKILSQLNIFLMMQKEMPELLSTWWDKAEVSEPLNFLHHTICDQIHSYDSILNSNQGITLNYWNPKDTNKTIEIFDDLKKTEPILLSWEQDALLETLRLTDQYRINSDAAFYIRLKVLAIFELEYGPVHSRTFEALASALPSILQNTTPKIGKQYVMGILMNASIYLPPKHPVFITITMHIQNYSSIIDKKKDSHSNYNELMDLFEQNEVCEKIQELPRDIPNRKEQLINLKARLLLLQSQKLRKNSLIDEALLLCNKAVKFSEENLGLLHELTVQALNNHAMLLMETIGDFEAGEKILKETLQRADLRIGKHSELGLALINNLAVSYGNARKYKEGLPYYRDAVERKLIVYGTNNKSTIHSQYNLAYCLTELKAFEEAEYFCNEAVKGFKKMGKAYINDRITMQIHLSSILQKAGKDTDAKVVFDEAFQSFNKLDDAKKNWNTYYNLTTHQASYYSKRNQFDKVVEIYWEQLEALSPIEAAITHTTGIFNKLKKILTNQFQTLKQEAKNEEVLKKIYALIKLHEFKYEKNHPESVHWKLQLGKLLISMANYTKAEPILRDVVKNLEISNGKDSPECLIAVSELTRVLMNTGKEEEAGELMIASIEAGAKRKNDTESIYKRIITKSEKENGKEHPKTLKILDDIGDDFLQKNQIDIAIKYYSIALERSEITYGPIAKETLKRALQVAEAYIKTDKYLDAEPILRRIADAYEQHKGLSKIETIKALSSLGNLLSQMQEYAEAIIIYEKILKVKSKKFGNEDFSTLKSLAVLINLYQKTENKEKYISNTQKIIEALTIISQPNSVKAIANNYLEKAKEAKKKRITSHVKIIKNLQKEGSGSYLGNDKEELEKTAEKMSKNSLDQNHPEGADEIELLIYVLNTLKPNQTTLNIWESFCKYFENVVNELDFARPMLRYNYSLWLLDYDVFSKAKEQILKVWTEGDTNSFFVQQAARIYFNLIVYDADNETVTNIGYQLLKDLLIVIKTDMPEIQLFKTQIAAYHMHSKEYDKAATLYSEILKHIPSGERSHLYYFNEIKSNLGMAIAQTGKIKEGITLCTEAWDYFSKTQQSNYFAYNACNLATVLELEDKKTASIPELRNFAIKNANILLNRLIHEKLDYSKVLHQLLRIRNITHAAKKMNEFIVYNNSLYVQAIIQKNSNYTNNMNETLWMMIENLDNIEDKESSFQFVVNLWEQTQQHEMIEKLKAMLN